MVKCYEAGNALASIFRLVLSVFFGSRVLPASSSFTTTVQGKLNEDIKKNAKYAAQLCKEMNSTYTRNRTNKRWSERQKEQGIPLKNFLERQ